MLQEVTRPMLEHFFHPPTLGLIQLRDLPLGLWSQMWKEGICR